MCTDPWGGGDDGVSRGGSASASGAETIVKLAEDEEEDVELRLCEFSLVVLLWSTDVDEMDADCLSVE